MRTSFWDEIKEINNKLNLPWVIGGDFNVERFKEERTDGQGREGNRKKFNEIIRQLLDLPVMDRKYTWPNMRENSSLVKLDRILISPRWESEFPLAEMRVCYN